MKASIKRGFASVVVAFLLSIGLIAGGGSVAQAADGVSGRVPPAAGSVWGWVHDLGNAVLPLWGDFFNTVGLPVPGPLRVNSDCPSTGCLMWDMAKGINCAMTGDIWTVCAKPQPGDGTKSGTALGNADWCDVNRCGGWDGLGATPTEKKTGVAYWTYPGIDLLDGFSRIRFKPGLLDRTQWSPDPTFCNLTAGCKWLRDSEIETPGYIPETWKGNAMPIGGLFYRATCSSPTGVKRGVGTPVTEPKLWSSEVWFPASKMLKFGAEIVVCPANYVLERFEWDHRGHGINVDTADNPAVECAPSQNQPCVMPGLYVNPAAVPAENSTILRSTLVCVSVAGGSPVTLVKEGPLGSGIAPQLFCPSGTTAKSGKVEAKTVNAIGWILVSSWEIPDTARDQYPECLSLEKAETGCTLNIWVDNEKCSSIRSICFDWYNGVYRSQPSRVQCKWGPYVVDMKNCEPLVNAYTCETGLVPDPSKPAGSALTCIDPRGLPLPENKDPNYTPPAPGPGGSNGSDGSNGVPGGTTGVPVTPPSDPSPGGENCWPSGLAVFNPVAWVLQPLKCGLSWAFVPPQADMTSIGISLQTSFEGVGFGDALDTLTGPVNAMGAAVSGNGCAGPSMDFSVLGISQEIQPFNACSGTMATVAGYSRAIISLTVIVSGGIAVVRALGRGFGFNFDMGAGAKSE